jgi:hypothetical protein
LAVTEVDYRTRINKLDSFFLWVSSLSGIGFSIFISYFKLPILTYAPVFVLIAIGVGVGYLNGAVFKDSFTNRMRGWNYVLMGLAIYVPFACLSSMDSVSVNNPDYSYLFTIASMFTGLVPVVIYLISVKKLTPKVYQSFQLPYSIVTERILNRTTIASVLVGFTLFLFGSISGFMSNWLTLVFFAVLVLFLLWPVITQEKRVKKLLPLENFQDCVRLEKLEKKTFFNIFQVALMVFALLLLIWGQLPNGDIKVIVALVSVVGFIVSILGLLFGLLYSDRGDMVRIKDTLERNLSESEVQELNNNVNLANS